MPWVEQPLWVPTHRDTCLSPNLKGPTLDMTANLPNTTEITIMTTGSHRGSLMQEAYIIYMTVKKSTFYLTGQEIMLQSDHLPLKKFLNHKTLNNTVDNWAVEI